MRKQYPSDIAREQFEHIRPLLEGARKKTAPRKVDLYEVFCAVLYCSKAAANGVCCLKFFPNGLPSIIILAYGISRRLKT